MAGVTSALRGLDAAGGNGSVRHTDLVARPSSTLGTRIAKRTTDIVLGSALALLAVPLIVVLAVVSAAHFRAWPIFVQRRVGRDGRTFPFPKVRTLPACTSPSADKYELARTVQIPRFGRFLRRSHLDELPQLFLVPLGWMSLVGPRPEIPRIFAHYPPQFAEKRTSVRPGCTGLWQISEAAVELIHESPKYDLAYLQHASLRLDAWTLYGTARRLLPGWRPITLDDVPRWALRRDRSEGEIVIDLREEIDLECGQAVPPVISDRRAHLPSTRHHGHADDAMRETLEERIEAR